MKLGMQHGVKLCQNNVEPMLPGKVNKQIGKPMDQPAISFQSHQYDVPQKSTNVYLPLYQKRFDIRDFFPNWRKTLLD